MAAKQCQRKAEMAERPNGQRNPTQVKRKLEHRAHRKKSTKRKLKKKPLIEL